MQSMNDQKGLDNCILGKYVYLLQNLLFRPIIDTL